MSGLTMNKRRSPVTPELGERDPEQSVETSQPKSTRTRSFTHVKLVTLGENLELQARARAGTISKRQQEGDKDGHPSGGYSSSAATAMVPTRTEFLVRTGRCWPNLLVSPLGRARPSPQISEEAIIAERVLSDVAQVSGLGDQVPYNCPNCGGVLWGIDTPVKKRYWCHTGHSYTGPALLASQSEKIEEMLWISLRMFRRAEELAD